MDAEVIEKAKKLVEEVVVGNLATIAEHQPRVRPVAVKWVGERELWFSTHTGSRKLDQIEHNAAVEVCFNDAQWNHVRLSGRASTTKDNADRTKLFGMITELEKHFSGPTDPNFTLVKIAINRIEYMQTGAVEYATHEF